MRFAVSPVNAIQQTWRYRVCGVRIPSCSASKRPVRRIAAAALNTTAASPRRAGRDRRGSGWSRSARSGRDGPRAICARCRIPWQMSYSLANAKPPKVAKVASVACQVASEASSFAMLASAPQTPALSRSKPPRGDENGRAVLFRPGRRKPGRQISLTRPYIPYSHLYP
jgi:hypothetical protein